MKKIFIIIFILFATTAHAQLRPITVPQGGTGWGNLQGGSILFGNWTGKIGTSTDLSFATTTSRLTVPYASTTAFTASGNITTQDLTINGICAGCDPTFDWTPTADGNSTSTRLIFGNGFISQASSTVSSSLHVISLNASTTILSPSITAFDSFLFSDGSTQPYGATPDGFGWNINTAVYQNKFFDFTAQGNNGNSLYFRPDGLKMYILGQDGDVVEYDLGSPWDVTEAVFVQLKDVSAQDTGMSALSFKPDGTKFYTVGSAQDDIDEWNMSTPWDISTAVLGAEYTAAGNNPDGLRFKPDGTKMYVIVGGGLTQFTLTSPWDITTAGNSVSFATPDVTTDIGLAFKPDGTRFYISDFGNQRIAEFAMTSPWDNSTATTTGRTFSVSTETTRAKGLFFKPDGTKMYLITDSNRDVYEYDLGVSIDGNAIFNSSVGIGTTSPSQTLALQGNAFFSGNLTNVANITATGTLNVAGLSTFAGFISTASSSVSAGLQVAGAFNASSTSFFNGLATFGNATATRLTVTNDAWFATSGGSVGIGTTSPSRSFSVQGSTYLSDGLFIGGAINATSTLAIASETGTGIALEVTANSLTSGYAGQFYSNGADTSARRILSVVNDNTAATGAIALYVRQDSTADIVNLFDGANEVFTVLDGGKVGIGTSTPYQLLSLQALGGLDGVGAPTLTINNTRSSNSWTVGAVMGQILFESDDAGGTGPGVRTAIKTIAETDVFGNDNGLAFYTTTNSGASSTEQMRIAHNGNVGVGTTSPWAVLSVQGNVALNGLTTLSGSGNVLCVLTGGQVVQDDSPITACSGASSLEYKKDIVSLLSKTSLEDILEMRPASFRYKETYKPNDPSIHYGFIAEEIAEIDPLLVDYDEKGNPIGLHYGEFVVKVISAMQEQQIKIEQLEARIKQLE